MRTNIVCRTLELADYVIVSKCTVRAAAERFGVSKSTVHKDLSERLIRIDKHKYEKVRSVLKVNLSERHIRGGIATKRKYRLKNQSARSGKPSERGE